MIKKIDIQNFGLFSEYRWNTQIGGDSSSDIFNKINIIYGRNYSGKTTLSRIFRCIEIGRLHENYLDSKFSLFDGNGNIITENNLICSDKIRVYNTDFIRENLSWLHDNNNGEIKPFTLLGSGNIEATNKIKEIETKLGSVEEKMGLYFELENFRIAYKKQETSLQNKKDNLYQLIQKHANQKIKADKYFVQQGANYNVTNIQNEIKEIINDKSHNYILDDKVILKHKTIIDEMEKDQINEISISKPNFEEYFNNVKILIEKKITLSETIKDLVADSLLQEWVDKGRSHHRDKLQKCAFCGGIITPERWKELDAHFSKESEELKISIETTKLAVENSLNQIEKILITENILKENYYSVFYDEFDAIKKKWDSIVNDYKSKMFKLLEKLQDRYNDIFNPKMIESLKDNSDDIVNCIELFNQLSKKNNEKSKTMGVDKNNSRKLLRYSDIARFLSETDYVEESKLIYDEGIKLSQPQKNIEDIEKRILTLNEEKRQAELKLNDEGEAAKKINNHLLRFFGHDSLSLEPEMANEDNPKTSFVIKRGNEKAFNLSEGECSLISFCYFIAKMEDELNSPNHDQLVIYIDDPISSLDNNHIFFMFSLIETIITKDEKYTQLFISTHNLDFLKYIKRLTIPRDDKNKELISHFIIEKRKKNTDYRCFLLKMPSYLRDYVTEYNFLFKEIYNIARPFSGERSMYFEKNFTLLYNLPNNMRRFLECYLFYRYPNTEQPLKNIGKLFKDNIPALVNRIINEYSHLTWGDRGTLVMDVAEAETVAKEIIKTLKNNDREHFEALCGSIGAEENVVISE